MSVYSGTKEEVSALKPLLVHILLIHLEKYPKDRSAKAPVCLILRVKIKITRLILNDDSGFIRAGIDDVICDLPSTACTDIFARVRYHLSIINVARRCAMHPFSRIELVRRVELSRKIMHYFPSINMLNILLYLNNIASSFTSIF